MILGFTGTQDGMTAHQIIGFVAVIERLKPTVFHHGNCIGADADAHQLVRTHFPEARIIIHPGTTLNKQANCDADEEVYWGIEPRQHYNITRNHGIVDSVEYMIACPKESIEQRRSGTWATIRYAIKTGRKLTILHPA